MYVRRAYLWEGSSNRNPKRRFSYLRVIARGSMAKYSSESGDIRAIGKELGARHVMEGSLRQAGTKLHSAVQLLDAVSGALSPRLRAGRADRAGLRKPRWPAPRATRHPAALSEAGSGTGRNWEDRLAYVSTIRTRPCWEPPVGV